MQAYKVKLSTMLLSEEFAYQLCLLHDELPVESKYRNYISKWLMTILTDEKTTTPSIDEFPIITKKVRDESLGERKKDFFRRSQFYGCAKVMLQHNLTLHLGGELGTFVYKTLMLKFMVAMCAPYVDAECDEFNIDLMSQMIAKMARRIDKLLDRKSKTITPDTTDFYDGVIRQAKDTIQVIRCKIDAQIQSIQREDVEMARLPPLNDLDFAADCHQNMPTLNEYLRRRAEMAALPDSKHEGKREVKSYRRYYKNRNRPSIETFNSWTSDERRIGWTEFENMALYDMTLKDEHYTEQELREW